MKEKLILKNNITGENKTHGTANKTLKPPTYIWERILQAGWGARMSCIKADENSRTSESPPPSFRHPGTGESLEEKGCVHSQYCKHLGKGSRLWKTAASGWPC